MKKKTVQTLQKSSIVATSFLLGVIITGTVIANENAAQINSALHTETYRFEDVVVDENDDRVIKEEYEYFPSKYKKLADLMKDSKAKVEEVMGEGTVLLKNDKALPLAKGSGVSLFSLSTLNPIYGGTGSGAVKTDTAPTFQAAFEKDGNLKVNSTLWDYYTSVNNDSSGYKRTFGAVYNSAGEAYAGVNGINRNGDVPWETLTGASGVESSFATYGDAAIMLVSRVGGEGSDLLRTNFNLQDPSDSTENDYLQLTPVEKGVLEGLKAKKDAGVFKKIIVLINTANVVQADFVDDKAYGIDGALWIGTPGQVGLNAVSDLLVGKINPSGHLSDTMWYDNDANPVNANFGSFKYEGDLINPIFKTIGASSTAYVVYQEGIYLGYRYTETRYEDYVLGRANAGDYRYDQTVMYPFGYGLSYTDFSFSNYSVKQENRNYTVSVTVKNDGDVAGKVPVQIYLQKPYLEGGIEKASVELVGYTKTNLLNPGETQTVSVEVGERSFASYDAEGEKTYVLDNGDYYLTASQFGAHEAINNILAAKGKTPSNTNGKMDSAGNADMVAKFTKSNLSHEDKVRYSWSEATDVKITNLFDFVDINRYEGRGNNSVEYVSRSNWVGTTHFTDAEHVVLTLTSKMADDIVAQSSQGQSDTIEKDDIAYPTMNAKNGLMLIDMRVDDAGNEIPYDAEVWDQLLDQLSWNDLATLVSQGIRRTAQIDTIAKPTTKDHNGPSGLTQKYGAGALGLAARTDDPDKDANAMCYPSGGIVAATFNDKLIREMGDMIGEEAIWAGYAGLYGPGSNIHRSPYSGRNYEYYSEDPFLSGMICANQVLGMQSHGMYVYNKHCFLNDQEYDRMGICTWANEQSVREIYGRAFELPITVGGAKNVMFGYNRLGVVWNGVSDEMINGFLRGECGMQGFGITDMWYFQSAYMNLPTMLLNGGDIVDGNRPLTDLAFAENGGYGKLAWAMRESAHRILYTVVHSNAMNGISATVRIVRVTPWWQILLYGMIGVFSVLLAAEVVWAGVYAVKKTENKR